MASWHAMNSSLWHSGMRYIVVSCTVAYCDATIAGQLSPAAIGSNIVVFIFQLQSTTPGTPGGASGHSRKKQIWCFVCTALYCFHYTSFTPNWVMFSVHCTVFTTLPRLHLSVLFATLHRFHYTTSFTLNWVLFSVHGTVSLHYLVYTKLSVIFGTLHRFHYTTSFTPNWVLFSVHCTVFITLPRLHQIECYFQYIAPFSLHYPANNKLSVVFSTLHRFHYTSSLTPHLLLFSLHSILLTIYNILYTLLTTLCLLMKPWRIKLFLVFVDAVHCT